MRRVGQVRSWVPTGPLTGFVCLLALLGVLAATTGLDASGWLAGVACGAGLAALLARALMRHSQVGMGPADSVTLARAVLACGVAALTVDSFGGQAPAAILVALSTVALVLDGVDGRVARRTDTTSAFGARFDMEVDAFLIMVLSVYVARESGWWVLAMGLARYAFVAAGWVLPWLRGPLPPRQWARVVAAIVGVVLTVAAADILPDAVTTAMLLVALGLLVESFGRSVRGLWVPGHVSQTRRRSRRAASRPDGVVGARRGTLRSRTSALPDRARTPRLLPGISSRHTLAGSPPGARATVTSALALLLVWAALLVPDRVDDLAPSAFLRIPVEGLLFVVLVLVLPPRVARILALFGGLGLGALRLDDGARAVFGAQYLREHVGLGYAVTVHASQGVTVGTTHAVLAETATRSLFYVAMTRGRDANTAYLCQRTPEPDDHVVVTTRAHVAVRGSGRDAAHAARGILARNDVPGTAHQLAADTVPQRLPDLVAGLVNRRSAALSRRRAAHRAWQTATTVPAQGADRSYTRDRSRDHGLEL